MSWPPEVLEQAAEIIREQLQEDAAQEEQEEEPDGRASES